MVRLAVGLETGPDSRLEVCFIKCVALGTVLQRAMCKYLLEKEDYKGNVYAFIYRQENIRPNVGAGQL